MTRELKTEQDSRLVYADIVRGYSCDPSGKFFLRHLTELDNAQTEQKRREFLKEAESVGLMSEKKKLELLAVNEHWTKEDEASYQQYQEDLNNLRLSLRKLIIPQQIEAMEKTIQEKEQENRERWETRLQLLQPTSEYFSLKRASEYHILTSFYQNAALTKPLFSAEELDDLSNKNLQKFIDIYHDVHCVFTEKNFKRIAICPFFLNSYLVSEENPYFFFGLPIARLSIYQLALFSRGGYYKHIIEESAARPPEDYYDDLDKVIQFYDRQYSIILGKRNSNQIHH
jgi:hypothetical protein